MKPYSLGPDESSMSDEESDTEQQNSSIKQSSESSIIQQVFRSKELIAFPEAQSEERKDALNYIIEELKEESHSSKNSKVIRQS